MCLQRQANGSFKNKYRLRKLLSFMQSVLLIKNRVIFIGAHKMNQDGRIHIILEVNAPQRKKNFILNQLTNSTNVSLKRLTYEQFQDIIQQSIKQSSSEAASQLWTEKLLEEMLIKMKNQDFIFLQTIETTSLLKSIKSIDQCKMFANSKFYFDDLAVKTKQINSQTQFKDLHLTFNLVSKLIQNANIVQNYENFANYFLEKFLYLNRIQFSDDKPSNQSLSLAYLVFLLENPQYISKQGLVMKNPPKKISLGEQIFGESQFHNDKSSYLDAIDQIQHFLRYSSSPVPRIGIRNSQKITQSTQFLANIQHLNIPDASCLGCTSFFYLYQIIFDHLVSTIPVYSCASIENMNSLYLNELLSAVCAFMNFGGGVILFGVNKISQKTIIKGQYLDKCKRILIKQSISRLVSQRIYPFIDNLQSIRIDFVPIVEVSNAMQSYHHKKPEVMFQREQQHRQVHYCEDLYVTRMVLCPYDSSVTYFVNENQILKSYGMQNGKPKQLTNRQLIKSMKGKINLYSGSAQLQRKYGIIARIPHSLFQHQCRQLYPFSRKPIVNVNLKEEQFLEMCLIFAQKRYLARIKRKIQEKGHNCSIELKFLQHKFQSARHTAVLYINLSFEQILTNISFSEQFRINNDAVLATRIQYHLKLQKRNQQLSYSRQEFKVVTEWLQREFPQQSLWFYEYSYNNQIEYYFKTETKTACLFLYYMLNHFQEKCSFKEPRDLQHLSMKQRSQSWLLLFRYN